MSKGFQTALVVIGVIIAGSVLLLVGIGIGRSSFGMHPSSSWNTMMGYGMGMHNISPHYGDRMMESGYGHPNKAPYRDCDGFGMGGNDMMGPWMMSGARAVSPEGVEPLTLDEAAEAVQEYIETIGDSDLVIGEVMVFDNHAYAQIVEESTGIGAMEVLVDPATLNVYPEMGPNMMWNLKYGGMGGQSGFGMMSGVGDQAYRGFGEMMGNPVDLPESTDDMTVSSEEAVELAQRYLDSSLPGMGADEHADAFYGYYTIHIQQAGETVGMLSVNGFTGEVFVHTWHGNLVEMS